MKNTVHLAIRELSTGKIVKVSSALPADEWPFHNPPSETVVWRYGDYRKFEVLFAHKKFYLRRADKLQDEFEGRFTTANRQGRSKLFGRAMAELGLADALEKIHEIQESHRIRTYLQCWHQSPEESAQMWQAYTGGPESLAIVSSVGRLAKVVGARCHGLAVGYIGEDFAVPEMHSLAPIAFKRKNFEYEKEFRLVHRLPLEERVNVDRPEDFFRLVDGDPRDCVQEARFHPRASAEFKRRVRGELEFLGYCFPVFDSRIAS